MYEEKLSPKQQPISENRKENELQNEKLNDITNNNTVEGEESKTDAVLDEIAAKVNALDLESDKDDHNTDECKKCMITVKGQRETINTLINWLRVMFEEYKSMNNEREYYEELNEALFRCLELNEGTNCFTDDSEDDDAKNVEENAKTGSDPSTSFNQTDQDDTSTSHARSKDEKVHAEMQMEEGNATASLRLDGKNEPEANEESGDITTETSRKGKLKRSELRSINEVLLREIFELRHQMEILKDFVYLNSEDLSQSEYDTATDDDHANTCEQCSMQCKPTRNEDETSEEYQADQEDETTKIADESDTE